MSEMQDGPDGSPAPEAGATTDGATLELTGHPQIDEALHRLEGLDELDIASHPEEFDAIHGVLRESLANAGRDEVTPDSA